MKFKTHGILLSLFFALGLVFSFAIDASGTHGDSTITAQDVADDPGNEQKMTDFVNRIVDYYEHVRTDNMDDRAALIRELTIFARNIRQDGGDYKHGDIYAIGITDRNIVTNHAGYPVRIGYRFNPDAMDSAVAATLKALLDHEDLAIGAPPVCVDYGPNNERVACAAKVEETVAGSPVTNIVGLRHAVDDSAFVPPGCEGLELATTAAQVEEDHTKLQAYVQSVIDAVQKDVAKISQEEAVKALAANPSLDPISNLDDRQTLAALVQGPITLRIQERLFCFGSEDFKYGSIYAFVMDADPAQSTVLVNGASFDLNGYNLDLNDNLLEGERNIARLFHEKLGAVEVGASATVEYHWLKPGDTPTAMWFEDRMVPGMSPKTSYIEVADLNAQIVPHPGEWLFIFGSGVYPESTPADGNDGACTIAGASNTSQGALLNLFLVASVLLSVVFLRRRA